ncbi:hypothetical protein ACTMSW_11970 [Micromonospora sp. BQ11]|uniref:hypothetical protein n=1 Tax=Micromonospora sp. BQ11 TaxID=3452212 RepID=UPI003F88AECD
MTMLTVRRHDGAFLLDGHGGAPARLRTGWTWRCGEIHTGDATWTVTPTDRHRIGVAADGEHGRVVLLDPRGSRLPGPGGPARWSPGRHRGELSRDGNHLVVRLPAWPRGAVRVDVTGTWYALELVVLTACFAMMTRRRRRTLTIVAIVGATGHGPVA